MDRWVLPHTMLVNGRPPNARGWRVRALPTRDGHKAYIHTPMKPKRYAALKKRGRA